jgi:hypothetical protein
LQQRIRRNLLTPSAGHRAPHRSGSLYNVVIASFLPCP